MKPYVILDTGPLVAMIDDRDSIHPWAKAEMAECSPPLLTCEPVVSEACFLLRRVHGGPDGVLNLVSRGILEIPFRLDEEIARVSKLMARYHDVSMSLADACLVRMAEQHDAGIVMTADSDFQIYRKHGRQVIPTIMPEQ